MRTGGLFFCPRRPSEPASACRMPDGKGKTGREEQKDPEKTGEMVDKGCIRESL